MLQIYVQPTNLSKRPFWVVYVINFGLRFKENIMFSSVFYVQISTHAIGINEVQIRVWCVSIYTQYKPENSIAMQPEHDTLQLEHKIFKPEPEMEEK